MAGRERPDELTEPSPHPQTYALVKGRKSRAMPLRRSAPALARQGLAGLRGQFEEALATRDLLAFSERLVADARERNALDTLRADQPAALQDPRDREIFWRLCGVLRSLQAADLRAEQLQLVEAALAGTWGIARISATADLADFHTADRQRGSAGTQEKVRPAAVAAEIRLYEEFLRCLGHLRRNRAYKAWPLEFRDQLQAKKFDGQVPGLSDLEKMIKWWARRGHNPKISGTFWRDLESGRAELPSDARPLVPR